MAAHVAERARRRSIRAVLFDWGDTLFYSPNAADAIIEAARQRGVEVDRASAQRLWEELWRAGKTPQELAKGRDLSPAAHRAVWTALFSRADAIAPGVGEALYERVMDPEAWVPYPDTAPTLRGLKQRGIGVGVVSNVARDIRPAFARHGLLDLVGTFVLSYEQGAVKPEPRLFLAACAELGVEPAETLMVGDHPITDGGAAAAGLRVHLLGLWTPGTPRGLGRILELVDAG